MMHILKHDRRSFLIGAAGIATQVSLPTQVRAAGEGLRFSEDFESGTLGLLNSSGNSPTVTSSMARAGNRCMMSSLDRLNSAVSYRSEVQMPEVGDQYWHDIYGECWQGLSICTSSDWMSSRYKEVWYQMHATSSWDWSISRGGPITQVQIPSDSTDVTFTVQSNQAYRGDASTNSVEFSKAIARMNADWHPGEWMDFVFHYVWDWRRLEDGGQGLTQVWLNGAQVVDHRGPNCYNDDRGPYLKFGLYKSQWKDRIDDDNVSTRTLFHDQFKEAGAGGSYDLVAPSNAELARPNPPQFLNITSGT